MAYSPRNANGSATSANSEPVVIASDQAAVATKAAAAAFADGWDVNSGATTDAVVAAGAAGSISAKLRRATTDLAALLAKLPAALGSTTSSASLPVVVASDQAAVASKAAASAYADGWDVNAGATADAVVAAGASGSISAKLRRLTTDLSAMSAKLPAALGQLAKSASMSVVLASDQDALGVYDQLSAFSQSYAAAVTSTVATAIDTAASSAFDNTTLKDQWIQIELNLAVQGGARSAGANVPIYIAQSLDGSTYPDILSTINTPIYTFNLDAAATARKIVSPPIRVLAPGLFKIYGRNNTGQAFVATTTISIRTF